jgi:vancomycin permeability regulator SanA
MSLYLFTFTALYTLSRTSTLETTSPGPVAIVFGAGLWRDGSPTPVLRARVETATNLYLNHKVQKLLMSGQAPEPEAMRDYAIQLGVQAEDIVLDNAGLRTYDTCYQAYHVFGLQQAILVTQSFHLPRALYICNHLGIPSTGVPAENRRIWWGTLLFWNIRESLATWVALRDIHIAPPEPVLGDP